MALPAPGTNAEKRIRGNYPESVDPDLPDNVVYNGKYALTDPTGNTH